MKEAMHQIQAVDGESKKAWKTRAYKEVKGWQLGKRKQQGKADQTPPRAQQSGGKASSKGAVWDGSKGAGKQALSDNKQWKTPANPTQWSPSPSWPSQGWGQNNNNNNSSYNNNNNNYKQGNQGSKGGYQNKKWTGKGQY